MRQAITTKYLSPTDFRGSRVKCYAEAGSKIYHWDYRLDVSENHVRAAVLFARELGWDAENIVGEALPDGSGYAFVYSGANDE